MSQTHPIMAWRTGEADLRKSRKKRFVRGRPTSPCGPDLAFSACFLGCKIEKQAVKTGEGREQNIGRERRRFPEFFRNDK